MLTTVRNFTKWVLFTAWLSLVVTAQQATLSRNTNLRTDPVVSPETKIRTLPKGTVVQLISSEQEDGFYHVTVDGDEGWVYARNVKLAVTPSGGPTVGISDSISPDWDKPEPQPAILESSEGTCGETGDGGDAITNKRKNRVDVPDSYHPVSFAAISSLSYPQGEKRSLEDWSDQGLAAIKPFQGIPITVEGFLYKVKVESHSVHSSGGESTNCHFGLAADVDWHMPLTANDGDGEDGAVIVETTPRIRKDHPNWTTAALKRWTAHNGHNANPQYNHQKVRISGWLMLDPEHQDMINSGLRGTLWEIHPVTKIEVQQADGSWTDLDQ